MCLANAEVHTGTVQLADALPSADRLCDLGDRLTDPGQRAVCYTAAAVLQHVVLLNELDDGLRPDPWQNMATAPADTPVLVYWPAIEPHPFVAMYHSSMRRWYYRGSYWVTTPVNWQPLPAVPR